MDQLSYLTNNYNDIQTVYYLTSSSIPTTIGKQYNTNVDGKLDGFFFLWKVGYFLARYD